MGTKRNVENLVSVFDLNVSGSASVAAGKAAADAVGDAAQPTKIVQKPMEEMTAGARRAAKEARDRELHELNVEAARARLAKATGQPYTPAAKSKILPDGQRGWGQSRGGPAKPGPAPTAEADLEATLKASIEAEQAKKAAGAVSPLQGPRLQIGAEKVGKPLGMTKEEVRLQAGPRLDEALGEASPILPDVPFGKIIDTMKALPKTGGFREAYVAKATSGKTRWQVENIRRQLEHLGLLVPAGIGCRGARRVTAGR